MYNSSVNIYINYDNYPLLDCKLYDDYTNNDMVEHKCIHTHIHTNFVDTHWTRV